MNYEWDPKKAEGNRRKHGVAFDEATTCFWTKWPCPAQTQIIP